MDSGYFDWLGSIKRHIEPLMYHRICLKGHLDPRWQSMLEGFTIEHTIRDGQPVTELTGWLPDQSALYGLLAKLRDIGAELISLVPGMPDGEG